MCSFLRSCLHFPCVQLSEVACRAPRGYHGVPPWKTLLSFTPWFILEPQFNCALELCKATSWSRMYSQKNSVVAFGGRGNYPAVHSVFHSFFVSFFTLAFVWFFDLMSTLQMKERSTNVNKNVYPIVERSRKQGMFTSTSLVLYNLIQND